MIPLPPISTLFPYTTLFRSYATEEIYAQLEEYTHKLYQRGVEMAKERGLILVDTKYEFGMKDGKIMLMDEIHTPDSSRYFYLEGYEERQARSEERRVGKECRSRRSREH